MTAAAADSDGGGEFEKGDGRERRKTGQTHTKCKEIKSCGREKSHSCKVKSMFGLRRRRIGRGEGDLCLADWAGARILFLTLTAAVLRLLQHTHTHTHTHTHLLVHSRSRTYARSIHQSTHTIQNNRTRSVKVARQTHFDRAGRRRLR